MWDAGDYKDMNWIKRKLNYILVTLFGGAVIASQFLGGVPQDVKKIDTLKATDDEAYATLETFYRIYSQEKKGSVDSSCTKGLHPQIASEAVLNKLESLGYIQRKWNEEMGWNAVLLPCDKDDPAIKDYEALKAYEKSLKPAPVITQQAPSSTP